jgi:hypothetical protein
LAKDGVRNNASKGELNAVDAVDAFESILMASRRSETEVVFGDADVTMPKWEEILESSFDEDAALNNLRV